MLPEARWMDRVECCIAIFGESRDRWLLHCGYRTGLARLFRRRRDNAELRAVAAALDSILADDSFSDVRWYVRHPAWSRRGAEDWTPRPPL